MSDEKTENTSATEPRNERVAHSTGIWTGGAEPLDYAVRADWTTLYRSNRPSAEMFAVSYTVDVPARPVTFVFNGGPGAASAFLHFGALGPRILDMPADGSLPAQPAKLVENAESWIEFTDLVFIDPIGTGLSKVLPQNDDSIDADDYYKNRRDLESLAEFMSRWLSANRRWGSPVYVAGESYGGYRAARLARMAQEENGVGINGVILISPALELSILTLTDYEVLNWAGLVPTMTAAAVQHGRSRAFDQTTPLEEILPDAEEFALGDYASMLARGASMPAEDRSAILERLADLIGLPVELVERAGGRITSRVFRRELLRDERRVLSSYDTGMVAVDPFPDREPYAGPDLGDSSVISMYTSAVNQLLRSDLGLVTDDEYALLGKSAAMSWTQDETRAPGLPAMFQPVPGSADDLRYAFSMNPQMEVLIVHGYHDLSTPYFNTARQRDLMRLEAQAEQRLTIENHPGGHMFYTIADSRRAFRDSVRALTKRTAGV